MLKEAIRIIQAGDKQTGQRLLVQILKNDPNNEVAWLWLSDTATSDKERRYCLDRVLAINPNNQPAQQGLRLGKLPAR